MYSALRTKSILQSPTLTVLLLLVQLAAKSNQAAAQGKRRERLETGFFLQNGGGAVRLSIHI